MPHPTDTNWFGVRKLDISIYPGFFSGEYTQVDYMQNTHHSSRNTMNYMYTVIQRMKFTLYGYQ